jgi:hypothetical protein
MNGAGPGTMVGSLFSGTMALILPGDLYFSPEIVGFFHR